MTTAGERFVSNIRSDHGRRRRNDDGNNDGNNDGRGVDNDGEVARAPANRISVRFTRAAAS
jgi:hypothetical protein